MKAILGNFTNAAPRAIARVVALCALCIFFAQSANAVINACRQADGSVTFQDTACAVVEKVEKKTVKVTENIPFGIEKSWFDAPSVVPDRAVCTKDGCHCDMYSRKYKNGIPLAIADALYLDGSWHRLQSTLSQIELPDNTSFELADLYNERDEAACNILMSQKTLRLFGRDALRELRNRKRYAEDRGLDDPDDCDAGDLLVCEYTDAITLYDRIQREIRSLTRNARVEDETATGLQALPERQSEFADNFIP